MWTVVALLNLYAVSGWAAATGLTLAGGAIIVIGVNRMLRQARARALPHRSAGGSFGFLFPHVNRSFFPHPRHVHPARERIRLH